jgi:hypothetical protein
MLLGLSWRIINGWACGDDELGENCVYLIGKPDWKRLLDTDWQKHYVIYQRK